MVVKVVALGITIVGREMIGEDGATVCEGSASSPSSLNSVDVMRIFMSLGGGRDFQLKEVTASTSSSAPVDNNP